ncbi:glycosyltransferase family 32 protein [Treponema berlinense]|uniref:glycosyltransferase family 32 protein n=1 Tax=Treponema berlinense TaxID=225004 RepID=UPI0026EC01EB|nr:capsular polysaccharide synthesis protein [Treponema berlinense]
MIPKVIHYVWLGNEKKPLLIKKCIESWKKKLPDYEIKLWNSENIPHNVWIDEALSAKKWAFVADYVRAWALYNYGGIYFDSDVFVKKSFDDFLQNSFFTGIEFNEKKFYATKSNELLNQDGTKKNPDSIIQGLSIQSAILGAEKGNQCIKDIMDFYENKHFINPDGTFYSKMIAPDVQAFALEKYGFIYQNKTTQHLNGGGRYIHNKIFCQWIKKSRQRLLCNTCLLFKLEKLFNYRKSKNEIKNIYKNTAITLRKI